jgi:hypothetical protein
MGNSSELLMVGEEVAKSVNTDFFTLDKIIILVVVVIGYFVITSLKNKHGRK